MRYLHTAVAYIDTVEVWFPCRLTAEEYRRIRQSGWWIEPCRNKAGRLCGYRLIVNQPDNARLRKLDRLAKSHDGVLSRFDLAVDIQADNAEICRMRILQQALLLWRRKGPMLDLGEASETTCWVDFRGKPRCARNLVLYTDKPNRITQQSGCVHLELRFMRAKVIKAQGIHGVRELIEINPRALFDRHVKWSDAGSKHVLKVIRQEVKKDRARYAHKAPTHIVTDRYRAAIPRRIRFTLHRMGWDRSQHVKDQFPTKVLRSRPSTPAIPIPTKLTWLDEVQVGKR